MGRSGYREFAERPTLHAELKRMFLEDHQPIREIAIKLGLVEHDVARFLAWMSREFSMEQSLRSDQLVAELYQLAQGVLRAANQTLKADGGDPNKAIVEAKKVVTEIMDLVGRIEAVADASRERRLSKTKVGRRPQDDSYRDDMEGEDEKPTGALEAAILPARKARS